MFGQSSDCAARLSGFIAGAALASCANDEPNDGSSASNLADPDLNASQPVRGVPGTPVPELTPRQLAAYNQGRQQPTRPTGYSSVGALSNKRTHASTDLLLHDMGPALADICNGVARPSDFRIQPLMEMQFLDMFTHDGESHTIADAVNRHGGEGAVARARFFRLDSTSQAAVVAFVAGL